MYHDTAFLNDFSKFYGTGEKNEAGQNLEEFLELYDPRKYETPSNTTDAVIFAYEGESCDSIDGLKVLLVKREAITQVLVTGHCRAVLPICGRI